METYRGVLLRKLTNACTTGEIIRNSNQRCFHEVADARRGDTNTSIRGFLLVEEALAKSGWEVLCGLDSTGKESGTNREERNQKQRRDQKRKRKRKSTPAGDICTVSLASIMESKRIHEKNEITRGRK